MACRASKTPLGRFGYEYGSTAPQGLKLDKRYLLSNLVRVRYPVEGQERQYHYEDAVHPTYMTGISIEGVGADGKPKLSRYATFGYNAAGKGILSTHANDIDKVTLDFEKNGVTTITNSLGQKTTYRYRDVVGQVNETNSFAQTLPDGSANPQWQKRQREIEIELALRTARMHNGDYDGSAKGGTMAQVVAEDRDTRGRQYALRFLNVPEHAVQQPADPRRRQPTADYFSLRCATQLPATAVPRGGLEMKPLQLN